MLPTWVRKWGAPIAESAENGFWKQGRLQPALFARDTRGFRAIARSHLRDSVGQVVAHRSLRERQLFGDRRARLPFPGKAQHATLAVRERIGVRPRFTCKLRIDDADAGVRPGRDAGIPRAR